MCGVSGGAFEVTSRSGFGGVFESSAQFRRFGLMVIDYSKMFSRFCQ